MEGKEYASFLLNEKKAKELKAILRENAQTKELGDSTKPIKKLKQPARGNQKPPIVLNFYMFNPRMLPEDTNPKLMFIKHDRQI